MEKALLRKFKDKLVKVFGRHAKRVHQGRLYGAGYFGDPVLIVTTFDNVDFSERRGSTSVTYAERASGYLRGTRYCRECRLQFRLSRLEPCAARDGGCIRDAIDNKRHR